MNTRLEGYEMVRWRRKLTQKYSWAVPNEKALQAITNYTPLIEIGAGTGFWAMLLKNLGVKIITYDLYPFKKNLYHNQIQWFPIKKGTPLVLKNYFERNLFLCWPPYNDKMALECFIDANNEPSELYGIKRLNEVILDVLSPNYLYSHGDFRKNDNRWPTVRELKGRVIIVLTSYWGGYWASNEGGFDSRLQYLNNFLKSEDDICFVSWIEEDRGKQKVFMKEKATFWKCNIELSTKHY